jgi:hypothetical protein
MCDSCVEIDKRIEQYRQTLPSITDLAEVERIHRQIADMYRDRVRSHKNPDR